MRPVVASYTRAVSVGSFLKVGWFGHFLSPLGQLSSAKRWEEEPRKHTEQIANEGQVTEIKYMQLRHLNNQKAQFSSPFKLCPFYQMMLRKET